VQHPQRDAQRDPDQQPGEQVFFYVHGSRAGPPPASAGEDNP
jgi:hypothetical protein